LLDRFLDSPRRSELEPRCDPGLFLFASGPASKDSHARLIQQAHSINNRHHEEGSHEGAIWISRLISVWGPIIHGTILFVKSTLAEQPNETLRSSLRLELSITPLEKLLDLVPNGTPQL
jgi:hypothetical protein